MSEDSTAKQIPVKLDGVEVGKATLIEDGTYQIELDNTPSGQIAKGVIFLGQSFNYSINGESLDLE